MPNVPAQGASRRRHKGARPKHVPQRTCVSCREKGDKRGLIRIVRTPERTVEIDPTGKRNGRGAYLCYKQECWGRAVSGIILDRALNTEIPEEQRIKLREFAATLGEETPEGPAATS